MKNDIGRSFVISHASEKMARRWLPLLLCVGLIQATFTLSPIPIREDEWENFSRMLRDPAYRLPTTTRPHHYKVNLTPYFDVEQNSKVVANDDVTLTPSTETTESSTSSSTTESSTTSSTTESSTTSSTTESSTTSSTTESSTTSPTTESSTTSPTTESSTTSSTTESSTTSSTTETPVPEIEPFTFDGEVTIYLKAVEENVNQIVLHCEDMTIKTVSIKYESVDTDGNNIYVQIENSNDDPVCEQPYSFLRLNVTETLQLEQEYVIDITYKGIIQEGMRGFYRSWYYDDTKTKRWMGTTQFQPGHARKAFPCYDEPGFKAEFDITIAREEDFSPSISNMPIKNTTTLPNGRIAETFYTTPVTSTYLVAFIVSHYKKIATNNNETRPFDIYARNNVNDTGDWSLDVGIRLLDKMEEFTNISYYDMAYNINMKQAAIPDFSAGAMENWGLLTYREALLLYDPRHSNHFYKQRVANIVSHEITHMWFGNLVTCAWWDNLWLNEGFARFYQYYLTGWVEKDLGYETRFVVEQVHDALFADSVDSAHALTNPNVNDPQAVSNHFSTITYARGASILRMTQHLLGEETYNKGLRAYLKERQFDVAEPHHLFNALDAAAAEDSALNAYNGITISDYFKTWSEKAGHPLLTVTVDQSTGRMTVVQARWERETGQSQHPGLWHIPITWTRGEASNFDNLKPSQIITGQATIIDRGTTGLEWVIFNKQQSGFYRVNYDILNWALITRELRDGQRTAIHEYNRAQIVDDLFALARAGVLPYNTAFNILSFLEFEDEYAPWIPAISGFNFLVRRLAHDEDNLQKLQAEIAKLSEAVTERLGYADVDGEPYMDGLLRMYVLTFLCNVGHEECIAEGKRNFQNWLQGGYIPPNMRPWVYCTGLREGTAADFDFFWERYLEQDLANDKLVMLQRAGCTTDKESLEKFLNSIVYEEEDVRPQDHAAAFSSAVTGNEINTLRVFEWLKNVTNAEATKERIGGLGTPLSYIAARLLNEDQINEFETWVRENEELLDSAYTGTLNNIDAVRRNLEWSESRVGELSLFFETGYVEYPITGEDTTTTTSTTPPTTAPTTSPTTPDDGPDSANITSLSVITLVVTLFINFINHYIN